MDLAETAPESAMCSKTSSDMIKSSVPSARSDSADPGSGRRFCTRRSGILEVFRADDVGSFAQGFGTGVPSMY